VVTEGFDFFAAGAAPVGPDQNGLRRANPTVSPTTGASTGCA
jgi:hypothetical protein